MTRVTIRVETPHGEVEVSEDSIVRTHSGREIPSLPVLLEAALTKIRRAYQLTTEEPNPPMDDGDGVTLSDTNRAMIKKAFDDGEADTTFRFVPAKAPGFFRLLCNGDEMMEGTEVNGTLYSIVPQSGAGRVAVLVGAQVTDVDHPGVGFSTVGDAREYVWGIAGL